MKKGFYITVSLAGFSLVMTAVVAVLLDLNSDLKDNLRKTDDERRKALSEKFLVSWRVGGYAEDQMFVRTCDDILSSATNGQCAAFKNYAEVLLAQTSLPKVGTCGETEEALRKPFYDSFLWRNGKLERFDALPALDIYLRINLDLMIHYGNLDIRNGKLELLPAKEYLALKTLNDYKKVFHGEGKAEFEALVDSYLKSLIAHIESPDGFTRICAQYTVQLNTDFANTEKPGKGVGHESAIKIGRAVAQGLVRSGYTPKWLDVDFPLPSK